ncbi:uncharacterized protein [Leptinotarsa decemlineata]|uniref:uncharacterized protein n=1 Tax=Leptinotarsa decemlineata TaxID=7539 RepID=UPI003D3087C8
MSLRQVTFHIQHVNKSILTCYSKISSETKLHAYPNQMEQSQQIQEPNELEAWKLMMDSMIKFIHASTKLMNTFNIKASNSVLPNDCEVECIPCASKTVQKQKKKVCAAAASQPQANETQKGDATLANATNPEEDNQHDATPGADETLNQTGNDLEETQPGEVAADDTQNEVTMNETNNLQNNTETHPNEDVEIVVEKKDVCVCKEIREIKETAKKAGIVTECKAKCSCSGKKTEVPNPELCACPVTSKEAADLAESMAQKLAIAQNEIDGLKGELEKLQFMESTRKSNTAALYKQIMKDTLISMPNSSKMYSSGMSSQPRFYSDRTSPNTTNRTIPSGSPPPPSIRSTFLGGTGIAVQSPRFPPSHPVPCECDPQQKVPFQIFSSSRGPMQSLNQSGPPGSVRGQKNRTIMQNQNESLFLRTDPYQEQGSRNGTQMQSNNESSFLRTSDPYQEQSSRNGTQMQSLNESSFLRTTDPYQEQSSRNGTQMQSLNESSFLRTTGPYQEQTSSRGVPMQSFNKSDRRSSGQQKAFMPSSFQPPYTSSLSEFPQADQSQLYGAPKDFSQMRPIEVECVYKKLKKKQTSPSTNQSQYSHRGSSQLNDSGRTMASQQPFRSIQVVQQRAVTVCKPPRALEDVLMFDDPSGYEDQCENYNCHNDICENQ